MPNWPLGYRRLGRNDIRVTEIAFGGGMIGGRGRIDDDDTAADTIRRAHEVGINYLDMAPSYGETERRYGIAFRRMGGKPKDAFIATKTRGHRTGDFSAAEVRRSLENSLRLLGIDHVDVAYVHSPKSMEPIMAPGGELDGLEALRKEGKLRWIGLAVQDHDKLRLAMRSGRFDVLLTFADYNLVRQTATGLIAEAAAAGMPVVLAQVFLLGLLAGPEPEERNYAGRWYSDYLVPDIAAAHEWWLWARERGVNLRAIALQYGLRNPHVGTVLCGAQTPAEIDELLRSAREPIAPAIWQEVEERIARRNHGRKPD